MIILNFCFLSCAIFYLVLCLLAILRLIKLCRIEDSLKLAIVFYMSMLMATLSRAISFYLISGIFSPIISKDIDYNVLLYLLIVIPDMINVCVYLFLVWYFFANFILSHINLANDLNLFLNDDTPTINNKTYTVLYIISSVFILIFTVICFLTLFGVLSKETLFLINSYFDALTPVLFFCYYTFLLIKLSGRPYISERLKMQVRKFFIVVCVWSATRIVFNYY